jgi:hypothetical protein
MYAVTFHYFLFLFVLFRILNASGLCLSFYVRLKSVIFYVYLSTMAVIKMNALNSLKSKYSIY